MEALFRKAWIKVTKFYILIEEQADKINFAKAPNRLGDMCTAFKAYINPISNSQMLESLSVYRTNILVNTSRKYSCQLKLSFVDAFITAVLVQFFELT